MNYLISPYENLKWNFTNATMRNHSVCVTTSCHQAKIWEGVDIKVLCYLQYTVTMGICKSPSE